MAVQIPFPLPSHGFAQNSKMRVNLDFLVDTFNQFNTGTATWDTVAVGIPNNETGTVTFWNSSNANYLTLRAGATNPSITYTLPATVPLDNSVLTSDHLGVWTWSASPVVAGIQSLGTATFNSGIRILNSVTGFASALVNASGQPSASDLTWSLPPTLGNASDVLTVDGSGHMSWVTVASVSGAANKALDNLATVAINTTLVSDTDNIDSLGTSAIEWATVYARNLQLGKDAAIGNFKTYAPSTLKGYIEIVAADNTANNVRTLITNAAMADNRTFTIPDPGASASFVVTEGAQTIAGAKTFSDPITQNDTSNQIVLGVTNTTTVSATAPLASRVVTIPDPGADATFLMSKGNLSIGGDTTLAAGKNIVLTDDTTNTLTLALPAAVTSYTLTLPSTAGTVDYILRTDGAGVTSWVSLTGAGGANNTLSNLADTVAINKNLNNFSAGTITASLTGHASSDLSLAGGTLTGNLQIDDDNLVFHTTSGIQGYLQIAVGNTSNWTMTLPNAAGTINYAMIDTDGAGTLGWAAIPAAGANPTLSNLADTVAINKNLNNFTAGTITAALTGAASSNVLKVGDTMTGALTINPTTNQLILGGVSAGKKVTISATAPALDRVYTFLDAGADANFVMSQGTQTIDGLKTFGSATAFLSTITTNGAIGVGGTPTAVTLGGVDIFSGGLGIVLGADSGASTRTNNTTKLARILVPHYATASTPVTMMVGSIDSVESIISIGGGTGLGNAATKVRIVTAANQTTTSGTDRLVIDSTGAARFSGTVSVPTATALYLDGGSNTYIYESAADTMGFVTSGSSRLSLSTTAATFTGNVVAGSTLNSTSQFYGGNNTNALEALYTASTETRGLAITNQTHGGYGSGIVFQSLRADGAFATTIAGKIGTVGADAWNTDATTTSYMYFYTVQANTLTECARFGAGGAFRALGTNTTDDATAGYIGEWISNSSGQVDAPASGTYGAVGAGITLTAGDWDISATFEYYSNSATFTSYVFEYLIGTATGNNITGSTEGISYFQMNPIPTAFLYVSGSIPAVRVSLSGSQAYYPKVYPGTYSAGIPKMRARISARRVR